jgi:hypothetical protein
MNEVKVQILEPESVETRLESRFDAFGTMIGVPQLCSDENVFARDPISGKSCLQRLAYLALVPVSFRAIEVSKSGVQRVAGRSFRHGCVGDQSAKPECRHMAAAVVERHSRHPKIRRFNHGYTSSYFAFGINSRIHKLN